MKERKNLEALRGANAQSLQKALQKRTYTYDYDGTIIFIRSPLYELMPPVLTDPRLKQRKAEAQQPEDSIHKFPSQMLGQEDMMKTFFPARAEKDPEEVKPKKRGGSKREHSRHFNSKIEPGGSQFEEMKMVGGVSMYEGMKSKRGGFDPKQNETLSRTQYLDQLSLTHGNLSNR